MFEAVVLNMKYAVENGTNKHIIYTKMTYRLHLFINWQKRFQMSNLKLLILRFSSSYCFHSKKTLVD